MEAALSLGTRSAGQTTLHQWCDVTNILKVYVNYFGGELESPKPMRAFTGEG